MGRLQGKVTVVTGAARGIGATLAKAFATEGARVVVTDIADTDATTGAIKAAGGEAIGCRMDVTSNDQIAAMVKAAEGAFGPIECLLNNAGMFATIKLKPFWELSEDEWDMVMRVNVRGGFQVAKGVLPSMRKAGRGKIVNISSGTVFHGGQGHMHYVTSKGGVIAMTRSGVNPQLISNYVRTSGMSRPMTANDVIYLHSNGVAVGAGPDLAAATTDHVVCRPR